MLKSLVPLITLIAAASLVNLANSTLTTVMPLRMLEDGASGTTVALFGAAFFLGFALGCFSQPPLIQRIGYIRAFAAAAGICTILAVAMDLSDSVRLWLVLRFFMGISVAAIFAAVDGWINGAAGDAIRGRVFATYGWCLGASAVVSQLILLRFDGMTVGFIVVLALAFNAALVLVAMTRTVPPAARPEGQADPGRRLVFTSAVSVGAAVHAGLVTTAILSVLPAMLAKGGIDDADIGAVIGAFFLGRMLLQIPLGIIADRVNLRVMVAVIAGLTGIIVLAGAALIRPASADALVQGRAGALFLVVMASLGGLVLPLYTLANSLAFGGARGQPAVRIATSLLLVNSAGAVAGPLLVAAATPVLGTHALAAVVAVSSGLMVALALAGRQGAADGPAATPHLSPMPSTSVASTRSAAEASFAAAGPEPQDKH